MTPMHETTTTGNSAEQRADNVIDLRTWRRPRFSLRTVAGRTAPDFGDVDDVGTDDDPPPVAS